MLVFLLGATRRELGSEVSAAQKEVLQDKFITFMGFVIYEDLLVGSVSHKGSLIGVNFYVLACGSLENFIKKPNPKQIFSGDPGCVLVVGVRYVAVRKI